MTEMEILNQKHHVMWQEIYAYERKFNVPQENCLVEMNAMGLAQYQPKEGVTPEQIEKAHAYLHEFEANRSPNTVPTSAIERLCSVYPEPTVFSMMSQSEKEGFIDYVEQTLDYFSPVPGLDNTEPISKTEFHLYQMAIEEREAQVLVDMVDEAATETVAESAAEMVMLP